MQREGARYANRLECLIPSIVTAPKFFICAPDQAKHTVEERSFPLLLRKSQVNSKVEAPGRPLSSGEQHLYGNYVKGLTVCAVP